MLSILIPIYQFDVRQLITALDGQCQELGIEYEILSFDDGSSATWRAVNRAFFEEQMPTNRLIYRELPQNLGRSGIRNALAKAAQNPYLLFMDCDSRVVRADYIRQYVSNLTPGTILYGGRCYAPSPPTGKALFLHWKYGIEREQSTPAQREQSPWHSFMTNNFVVPKAVMLATPFDESLRQYGHEDTLFGLELQKKGIQIRHLNNPLEHTGLEPAAVFLEKTKQGLQNLALLWQRGAPIDTKLLRTYLKIRRLGGAVFFRWGFHLAEPLIRRQLLSERPSLFWFDVFKLGWLSKEMTSTLPPL
jgi:hypothetical protein